MSKKTFYYQCELRQADGTETVAWIPEKYCAMGKGITIKDDDGEWSERWEVMSFNHKTDTPPDFRKFIRSHRQATGDSLPGKFTSKVT